MFILSAESNRELEKLIIEINKEIPGQDGYDLLENQLVAINNCLEKFQVYAKKDLNIK